MPDTRPEEDAVSECPHGYFPWCDSHPDCKDYRDSHPMPDTLPSTDVAEAWKALGIHANVVYAQYWLDTGLRPEHAEEVAGLFATIRDHATLTQHLNPPVDEVCIDGFILPSEQAIIDALYHMKHKRPDLAAAVLTQAKRQIVGAEWPKVVTANPPADEAVEEALANKLNTAWEVRAAMQIAGALAEVDSPHAAELFSEYRTHAINLCHFLATLTTMQQEKERMEAEKQEAAKAWGRYALLRIDHENPYAGCEDLAALTDYFDIDFATQDGGDGE